MRFRFWSLPAVLLVGCLTGCGGEPPPQSTQDSGSTAEVDTAPAGEAPATPEPRVTAPPPSAQAQFWSRLAQLCNGTYAGYLTIGTEPGDREIGEADLSMQALRCAEDEIDIAFHVGADRTRTWQFRRTADAMTLHHDHRDPDGTPHDPTGYGGSTQAQGKPGRQEFAVDDATVASLPQAAGNVWAFEVTPGKQAAYELQRARDDRYFRVEFDLTQVAAAP